MDFTIRERERERVKFKQKKNKQTNKQKTVYFVTELNNKKCGHTISQNIDYR